MFLRRISRRSFSTYHTDVYGRKLLLRQDGKKLPFYYDPETFESYEQLLSNKDRPQYSTEWEDPKHPGWVQYLELGTKRHYYVDRANPISSITWTPPNQPDLDIFAQELERLRAPLSKVGDDIVGAPLSKRFLAGSIDVGISMAAGLGFSFLVYIDVGRIFDAQTGFAFSSLAAFLVRDSIFERGTRSIGKRLMKLEIVKTTGELPTRWNTAFRQLSLPGYVMILPDTLPFIAMLLISDVGLMLFTERSYRIGDLIGRTRVILEQPDREKRFKEKCQREDADDAKE